MAVPHPITGDGLPAPPPRGPPTPEPAPDVLWAALLRAVEVGTRRLPRSVRPAVGRGLGDLCYRALRRHREVALRNLAAAYPEWGQTQVQCVARDCFRHLGKSLLEFLALP